MNNYHNFMLVLTAMLLLLVIVETIQIAKLNKRVLGLLALVSQAVLDER